MLGYGMFYWWDPTYVLVLIGAVLSMLASAKVNSTFSRYAKVKSGTGMTGAMAAQRLLNNAGINDVRIEHVRGNLTDHYDSRTKTLRLSDATYSQTSVAAIGVAAHECGHAIQDNEGYVPLSLRSALVPAANIGSRMGIPIIFLGLLLGSNSLLITIGIWVFSLAVLFQLVTLPVEFNASSRAVQLLDSTGVLYGDEITYTKKVLSAAALTYVAAAAASILQLLRLIILFGGRRRDD